MKVVYKTKWLFSTKEKENMKELLKDFFGIGDHDILIVCDVNFEYSDLIIINENTISR